MHMYCAGAVLKASLALGAGNGCQGAVSFRVTAVPPKLRRMNRKKDAAALSDGIWQDRDILFDLESR